MASVGAKGRLLVATPPLDDPNFDRSVVYVLEHHDDGAIGVVINRPTDEALDEPLDRWSDLQVVPSSVFIGGPVETSALIALGRASAQVGDDHDTLTTIAGPIVSVDLTADPAIVAADLAALRVFRGYAGWGAGQLDAEIESGAWLVLDGDADDVFADDPDELWRDVLRRQPGRLAWLAEAPDDLSLN
ncbi:MAG: YqgE/AlgH family protein [Actinomycetota bacterium]